jgi:hypothetical protein
MALIPTTQPSGGTTQIAWATPAGGGDTFIFNGPEKVLLKAGIAQRVVTFTAVGKCSHGFLHNLQVTVPANQTVEVRKPYLTADRFANPSTRQVAMTYDDATGLEVAVLAGE